MYVRATFGGLKQGALQFVPNRIVEQDERLEQHFVLSGNDGSEDTRVILFAVLQQRNAVARHPVRIQDAWRLCVYPLDAMTNLSVGFSDEAPITFPTSPNEKAAQSANKRA
jgi:hypothetical protein